MIITWDLMTNFKTYNINNVTTTGLPICVKYPYLSSEVKYHYLYTHEFNSYLIQSQD